MPTKQQRLTYLPQWTTRQVRQTHGLLLDLQTEGTRSCLSWEPYCQIRQRNAVIAFKRMILVDMQCIWWIVISICGSCWLVATLSGWHKHSSISADWRSFYVSINIKFSNTEWQRWWGALFLPLQHQEDGVPLGNLEESIEQLTFEFRWGHSISVQSWVSQLMLANTTAQTVPGTRQLTIVSQLT